MVGVAGAGAFVKDVPWVFDDSAWGHAQDLDLSFDASHIFSMLQTVQRAEYCYFYSCVAGLYACPLRCRQ